jgi:hypothetical protein
VHDVRSVFELWHPIGLGYSDRQRINGRSGRRMIGKSDSHLLFSIAKPGYGMEALKSVIEL